MIGDAKWYLGGSSTYEDVTTPMFYTRERGTKVYSGRGTSWTGKVGLMYQAIMDMQQVEEQQRIEPVVYQKNYIIGMIVQ